MQLLINTGGKGTRLYPLTVDLPKPMLPVEGKPVLERLVLWGIEHGITEFVFLNGFKHEMIEDYFGNGKKWGVSIVHSNEPKPLGSGGPLKYAYDQGLIKGRSAFIMGDLICHVDLKKMITFHEEKNAVLTILVHKSDHPYDSDLIQIDENARMTSMIKKGTLKEGQPFVNLTNAGLTILEQKVFEYLTDEKFTYEHYVYPKLVEAGEKVYGYDTDEYIKDMGTPKRLEKVTKYLQDLQDKELQNK